MLRRLAVTHVGNYLSDSGRAATLVARVARVELLNRSFAAIPIGARLQWRSRFYNRDQISLSRPSIRPYRIRE